MVHCECFTEVERLHQFFSDWFVGSAEFETFGECESALASGFTIVMPDGRITNRDPLLGVIRDQYGTRDDSFSIDVISLGCRRLGDVHITRYEERHHGSDPSRRLSTAVMSEVATGFQWQTVHETWL